MSDFLLALDQGTTSTRAIVFSQDALPVGHAQVELPQIYPRPGWVEHDPEQIWRDTVRVAREAVANANLNAADIAAIGLTNQRETVVLWDRESGRPVHNAIVWQDRRTAPICDRLEREGNAELIQAKTGLVLDPYFSASKLTWLLDKVDGARAAAMRGELAFGTVDSFLLSRLTGGSVHATDATNAARTSLLDINTAGWDDGLFDLFAVPRELAPVIKNSADEFGTATADFLGREIPIFGMAGDQQAAAIGQACFERGMIKATYGTGAFILMNTGPAPVLSQSRLLTTIAYRLGGKVTYATEGSIFAAGSTIQWLRDELDFMDDAAESEELVRQTDDSGGIYLVPAFTGLGAPYWDPDVRGAIVGLTRGSGRPAIVRAALESVAYQTRDILDALAQDGAGRPTTLRVDGGMVENRLLLGLLADILDLRVERPQVSETTALGAAMLAGLGAGLYRDIEEVARLWKLDRGVDSDMPEPRRQELLKGWRRAVDAARSF